MLSSIALLALPVLALATPLPSGAESNPLLVVRPPTSASLPPCAIHLPATLGAQTRLDLHYLSAECATQFDAKRAHDSSTGGLQGTDRWRSVRLNDRDLLRRAINVHGQGEISRLMWLHPVAIESAIVSSSPDDLLDSTSGQFTFRSSAAAAPLDPSLVPTHLLDLPDNEGSLALLSSDPAVASAQLSYLSSHPAYSYFSLVSLPTLRLAPEFPEVPEKDVKRVVKHLETLEFRPLVSTLLDTLEEKGIRRDVRILSAEDQSMLKSEERWVSRHSMSEGGLKASDWVTSQMSSYGFSCTQHSFLPNFAPMVECVYERSARGSEVADDEFSNNETVVLAAHFDSRGSFGYPTAPGADDDGSGTALVLAVARHIWTHRLRFGRKLIFALYAGEEQGLLGSKWHAHELKHVRNEDVVMMLQVDMVGYRKPGEPLQLALPDLIGLPEASYFVGNVSNLYVPELVVGRTPACCSDHQSHVEQGYAATWIFERNGPIADPCYHNSCDLSTRPGYSFEQIRAHARVVMAVVLELGGYSFE